jgi:hypothetical protein
MTTELALSRLQQADANAHGVVLETGTAWLPRSIWGPNR